MKRKNIILITGFLLVIIAVAVIPGIMTDKPGNLPAGGPGKPGGTGVPAGKIGPGGASPNGAPQAVTVRSETAAVQDVQEYLILNGDVDFSSTIDIFPDTSGKIAQYSTGVGDRIKKNTLVATINPSRPGERFELSPVYAPVNGLVIDVPYSVGATVTSSTSILRIAGRDDLEIQARVIERDIAYLEEGLTAEVYLEAWPEEVFNAAITQVNPFLDSASRSKEITLTFDKTDPRINAGMFVRIKLNTRLHRDVITVPDLSIRTKNDEPFVWVIDSEDKARKRNITTGKNVNSRTIIHSGITAGDKVIVEGIQSLTDGVLIRDITQNLPEGDEQ